MNHATRVYMLYRYVLTVLYYGTVRVKDQCRIRKGQRMPLADDIQYVVVCTAERQLPAYKTNIVKGYQE
jgi:hypothetical protein